MIAAVKQAIEENPKAVNDYLEGQKSSLNFLVGQVMRLTRGKADPGETVKIDFYDERLTTMMAERVLIEADMRRNKRKQIIDKQAAVIILQSYLDSKC